MSDDGEIQNAGAGVPQKNHWIRFNRLLTSRVDKVAFVDENRKYDSIILF